MDRQLKERLRTATVEVILVLRAEYLACPGVNPLDHWDQLESRIRIVTRTVRGVQEWVSELRRALRLPAPSSRFSEVSMQLVHAVAEGDHDARWLDLVERELGHVLAMARLIAEQRREEREARGDGGEAATRRRGSK